MQVATVNAREYLNKGTIELIYFPGSTHEKHFFFNKTEAISRIINNDSTTVIFFHDHFVNQLDSMNYLAASYFKLKFFDVNGVEEINLDSFSSVASLRMPKIKKPVIYYDKENGTYFTNNRIEIKTTAAQELHCCDKPHASQYLHSCVKPFDRKLAIPI